MIKQSADAVIFPTFSDEEIDLLRPMGQVVDFPDGHVVFRAGDRDIDLWVVISGHLDVLNPTDHNQLIVTHEPGHFAGDIDLLTRRPVIVTTVTRGPTQLLRVPGSKMRELLNRIPRIGDKLLNAFTQRRERLAAGGVIGLKIYGAGHCRETSAAREFLYKNFVPFAWFDPETVEGKSLFLALGSPKKTPAIELGDGRVMLNPSLRDLACAAGVWHPCPDETVDFAVVGAGPAGIAAAVYAASEGVSTLVLDRLGPGGQAGGSSKIENFIGFPAGLSGTELATRGVLQMLKFGAKIAAPVSVERLTPAARPGEHHSLKLDCGSTIRARSVLVATGVHWRKLQATNADRFERQGVYYACTSVEALMFDKCDVTVVGGGNSAGQAAMFLAECCRDRTVHMLVRSTLSTGMSQYLSSRVRATKNIVLREGVEVTAVNGKQRVESADIIHRPSGETCTLPCQALFVFIGADPQANWLPENIARDTLGYLMTGTDAIRSGRWPLSTRDPLPLETTIPGILAAGDIRSGSTKRVGFAVGDGSLAVTCVHRLIALGL